MSWNKEDHIKEIKPSVDRFVSRLKSKGIDFTHDEVSENIILTKGSKELIISNHSFYRYSGICFITKEISKTSIEHIRVTPDMYFTNYLEPVILKQLN